MENKIICNGIEFSYSERKQAIVVRRQGQYRDVDGNTYPYTSKLVEGAAIEDIWETLRFLSQRIKGLGYMV